ncbi:B-4DMT family transporter [Kutzneria kofuensis]|uniref:Uncharacterized protein n=1 Tax=Kutzneria kofuensis TaxID=103725 RepID=A0A7W9KD40_9PSEU|nr:B-4DMT family transporter [Kutzneria kofuensis]MBB5889594.1 hypothetical protein [Kutzneria kofuensis]
MRAWLLRGLVLAVVHAAVQTGEAWVRAGDPTAVGWLRPTALGLLVGVAVLWSGIDGWLGREGRGMVWFFSALVAGPVGGVLGVIGQGVFVDDTGAEALPVAITGGAAFIALLVLVPAGVGLLIGRLVTATRAADSAPATPPTPVSRRTAR